MPPDLNSLPNSRFSSSSPFQSRTLNASPDSSSTNQQSLSPRSSSVSLAAAATMNAADISRRSSTSVNRGSPQTNRMSERRRSGAALNLNLSDPSLSGSGESPSGNHHHRSSFGSTYRTHSPTSIGGSPSIATGDPHHQRAPSIGEIHQELEQEQEAQVNRLLGLIRSQQTQLNQIQQTQQQQGSASGTAIADDSTPTSERSVSFSSAHPLPIPNHRSSLPLSSGLSVRRGSNQAASPALHAVGSQPELGTSNSSIEWGMSAAGDGAGRRSSRDDGSLYQAEAAMLTRENQMLKTRIRELERQVQQLMTTATPSNSNLSMTSSPTEPARATASGRSSEPGPRHPAPTASQEPEKS